jgi:23S rRNA pseudouridine1911/1915/1917 synthase
MITRTLVVSRAEVGQRVLALVKLRLKLSWSQARRLIEQNRVRQGPGLCRDPHSRARLGQKIRVQLEDKVKSEPPTQPQRGKPGKGPAAVKRQGPAPDAGPGRRPVVRHEDDQIVVVDKPAGLTTMRHAHEAAEFGTRGKRFLPTTLAEQLPALLKSKSKGRIIAVHRLDRDTSGLVVFARTPTAARLLGAQFRGHDSERTYVALVRGRATSLRIESWLVQDRGDGRRGSAQRSPEARCAVTHVRVLEDLGDFTLVECRLETGRTHQVRIHLGDSGTPLCGERIYDRPLHGAPLPDTSGAERPMLHAGSLAIDHPATGQRMNWTAGLPEDMLKLLRRLRKGKG